jgi:hypothetical protein
MNKKENLFQAIQLSIAKKLKLKKGSNDLFLRKNLVFSFIDFASK